MYEWTFTTFLITFGSYLHFVHQWGKSTSQAGNNFPRVDSSDYDSGKGLLSCIPVVLLKDLVVFL